MPRRRNPHPYKVVVTRYVLDGKRVKAGTPGATREVIQSGTYYADLPGNPRTPLGTDSLEIAWKRLNEKLKEHHETELGIRDGYSEHAKTPLLTHLDQWCATLAAKGTTAEQVELTRGRLTRLAEMAAWKRLPEITGDAALKALALVQTPKADGGLGKSAQTRNYYLSHLKAFVAWATDGGRLRGNPVRGLRPVNVEADRRHLRRSPSTEEIDRLFAWLGSETAPVRRGLTPAERRLGYQVSMATGFRAGELRALMRESFDLEAGTLTVPAAYSKRRRTDTQTLPSWLADELRAWFKAGGGWGWDRLNKAGPGKLLQADLEAAGITYRIETPRGPEFFDFHSLRHWYCTQVGNLPGMDMKTLLSLTRHSTPALALKTYAKAQEQRIKDAVNQILPIGTSGTGTPE